MGGHSGSAPVKDTETAYKPTGPTAEQQAAALAKQQAATVTEVTAHEDQATGESNQLPGQQAGQAQQRQPAPRAPASIAGRNLGARLS